MKFLTVESPGKRLYFLRMACILLALAFPGIGLAADATSFDPTTVAITSQGTIPVGTVVAWPTASNPADMGRWLECNGQTIPAGSQYERLRAILGGQPIPNYNGQFLRGTTVAGEVGQKVQDTIRAHSHDIDAHQHSVSGSAAGQEYSGSIPGQSYHYDVASVGGTWWPAIGTPSFVDTVMSINHSTEWDTTARSSYSGTTSGGSITGFTNFAGGQPTHETGGAETAPVHTKVRYLIRAVQ